MCIVWLEINTQALVVDALADKRLYEQELGRTREENAFLQDQVWAAFLGCRCRGAHQLILVFAVYALSGSSAMVVPTNLACLRHLLGAILPLESSQDTHTSTEGGEISESMEMRDA